MKKPNENTIFNQFNYRNYLKSKKIYYTLEAENVIISDYKVNIIYKIEEFFLNIINKNPNRVYLNALVLGNKDYIEKDIIDSYSINGVSHLLAISGMHVSLLSLILSKIFRKKHFLISLFIVFYTFLAGFTPSVIRACCSFIFKNKFKAININIVLACVMLVYNPFLIYNVGFLFSFIISTYMILFLKFNTKNYFLNVFKTSVFCFIISIPILVNNYYYINLMSPLINVIFVPFISVVIFPLLLSSLIIPIDYTFLIKFMENISISLSDFNIMFSMRHLNFYIVILYYLLITIFLYKKKYIFIVLLIIIHINYKQLDKNNYLTMIDVGQGDCFLLELGNKTLLIDTGYGFNYELHENIINYIRSRGINKIDYLIITHGDNDHLGEAADILDNFEIEKILLNNNQINENEKVLHNYNYEMIDKHILNINGIKIEFINKTWTDENNSSLVFILTVDNKEILFTADIGIEVEQYLISNYDLSNIDFLKVAHHGSKTSTGIEFIKELNPKYSLISVGKNNIYGHPNEIVLNNLSNSKIYLTSEVGSVLINFTKDEIETCN